MSDVEQTQRLERPSGAAKGEPLAAIVHVVKKGIPVESLRMSRGNYRVGAGADNDLVVEDRAVSRAHVELSLTPRGVQVVDLQSRNGTHYLDQRIGQMEVAFGGRVRIGQTELCFEADQADFEGTQGESRDQYGALVGRSAGMHRLFTLMERLEGSLVNVLVEGESGTGKELVARALHDRSQVARGPFVALNCGALDRSLVRSELFGHKKGAFTGASSDAPGAIEEAQGGTLFLDEIGELPLEIQPVLLRVLESGRYARVGEHKERPAQVRVIAATHRDLKKDVAEGLFRSDLYYRLMVVRLTVPPLRNRPEDIKLLCGVLAERAGLTTLPDPIVDQLRHRSFPGNVRELAHAISAYGAIGELPESDDAVLDDLSKALTTFIDVEQEYAPQKERLIEAFTRAYLAQLVDRANGNRSEMARVAGLQRGYLRRLLEKHGLD